MKQLERKAEVSYNWWRDDGEEIKQSHIEALEEAAEERIAKMRTDGFTSGELNDNISMDDEDGEDGISYSGWWTYKSI